MKTVTIAKHSVHGLFMGEQDGYAVFSCGGLLPAAVPTFDDPLVASEYFARRFPGWSKTGFRVEFAQVSDVAADAAGYVKIDALAAAGVNEALEIVASYRQQTGAVLH